MSIATAPEKRTSVPSVRRGVFASLRRVLYHHRTQGKAVEGVHIRGVTDALRAEGVAVDVMSPPGADPYFTPSALSPTKQARPWMRVVARLPEPFFELAELGYNIVSGVRVARYLARHRDTDMIYERYSLFMFVTVLIARWRRVPIVLEVNDSALVDRVRPLFFRSLATMIEHWTFRRADGLVFVSSAFRDRAIAGHGRIAPTIVTPNAANIAQFSFTAAQRDATRERLGLKDAVVCGYLGAFVPWHSIDRFVYEIAERLQRHERLKLLLVGDGETYPAVKAFVEARGLQDRIVLAGRVPHTEVPNLLSAMDLAVLPNAGDYTSPVKLFEFMACGIPAVAPDYAPVKEVLEEGKNGWLFPANDLRSCAEEVLRRCDDDDARRRVGKAARSYVEQHRQWRNNVVQLAEFLEAVRTKR